MVRLPSTARLHPDLGLRAAAIPEECAPQVWQRAHHGLTPCAERVTSARSGLLLLLLQWHYLGGLTLTILDKCSSAS